MLPLALQLPPRFSCSSSPSLPSSRCRASKDQGSDPQVRRSFTRQTFTVHARWREFRHTSFVDESTYPTSNRRVDCPPSAVYDRGCQDSMCSTPITRGPSPTGGLHCPAQRMANTHVLRLEHSILLHSQRTASSVRNRRAPVVVCASGPLIF